MIGKLVGFCVLAIALFGGVSGWTAWRVARQAQEIAGTQPYCLQVADDTSDYRPARSWFDLSVFAMRAARDGQLYMQHHGILIVGAEPDPKLFHWSYRHGGFELGVLNGDHEGRGPTITCLPVPGFASTLTVFRAKLSGDSYVKYSGREAYRIPNVWQARWSGGGTRTLRLLAPAPDFRPLDRRWRDLSSSEWDHNWLFIEWNPEWLLSSMNAPSAAKIVEQGMEFGLFKQTTITPNAKGGKDYVGYRYFTYGNGEVVNTTMIGYGAVSEIAPKPCQHRFINKGRLFYFRHRPEDVADWQGMQQRVITLMDTFAASANK